MTVLPKTKKYLEHSHGGLGQHDIDRLFSVNDQRADAKPSLAKGLNETTLAMIREYLQNNRNGFFTSEQIAEQIHLSRITIRRYMNYMVDTGEIISTIDYKTGAALRSNMDSGKMIVPPAAVTIFTKPVTYLLKLTPCTKSFILFIKFLHIFINVNGV